MSTQDFIIALFYRVDEIMGTVPKHPQAQLYPSEVVTLALLFALKGVGPHVFAPLDRARLSGLVSPFFAPHAAVSLVRRAWA